MKDPIIRTGDMSIETIEALYKTIKGRHGIERAELKTWRERQDAELTLNALLDMHEQVKALERTKHRLARRLRLANIPV